MVQNSINDGLELSKGDAIYRVMTNGEAATELGDGTVVILDTSDSSGKTVILPTAEGVPVFGVVVHPKGKDWTYAVGEDCLVCVNGVAMTQVDGTDDIAAGSRMKAFDTNGVGYEAVPGTDHLSCIFGVALDAYTTNDSLGFIPVFVGQK